MTLLRFTTLTSLVILAACEAGPSAFDRGAARGVPDTADVSELPPVPDAPSVETLQVADTAADAADAEVVLAEADTLAAEVADSLTAEDEGAEPQRFPRPEHVRGLYLNAWAAGSSARVGEALEIARATEINSFVIDIKDASGFVSHATEVPVAHEAGATEEIRIRDLPGLLERLEREGIYPIARIVIVKDPILAAARPELAVQDSAGGVWVDGKGIRWLNPYHHQVWDYHVDLALEVARLGFPEIQWDYVRFPDAPIEERERAVYPGAEGREKPQAIRDFLAYSREALDSLGVLVTADVFGVTTSASRDVGIGQVWESLIDVIDVALPMVYPSHYWEGSFGLEHPNAFPYEVVRHALEDALRRSAEVEGAGLTRPWLQDFSLGEPAYGPAEVRAQIQATYDAGVQEWILWNPSSRYTVEALEPVGGFAAEPLIRVADQVVPASERFRLLEIDSEAKPDSVVVEESADSTRVELPGDSTGVGGPRS